MGEERLWAPWRLEYITGAKPDECIFCVKPEACDDASSRIVHRGERCFVKLNTFPYNNGHLMVAPYRHLPSLLDLEEEDAVDLTWLTRRSLAALRHVYGPDGFNVGINEGRVAGAGVEGHLHQHVVPRWDGDTSFMPVVGGTRVLPESLDDSWRRLSEAFAAARAPT